MRELLHTIFGSRITVYLFLTAIMVGLWTIARKIDLLE